MTAIHWLNPISGSFTNAANWSGGVVPGASDDAFVDASGATPYTVKLQGLGFVSTLQLAAKATLDVRGTSVQGATLSAINGATNAGSIVVGKHGHFDAGASGNGGLNNSGNISASAGGDITLNGAVDNSGTIAISGKSYIEFTFPCVLTGGGAITLGGSTILGGTRHVGLSSLTNVDNLIEGSGRIIKRLVFTNEAAGVVDANAAGALTISVGPDPITNAGLIEATNDGACLIKSAVNNTGTLKADGGTLTLDAAVTGSGRVAVAAGTLVIANAEAAETVTFVGDRGMLELTRSQTYSGQVKGFSTTGGTTLDLRDIGFVGAGEASFSGTSVSGILTVTDGTHTAHITLKGDYLGATFVASSDGSGGTDVVATSGAASARPHRLIAAMAGLGGSVAETIHLGQDWTAREPALAAPRAVA